MKNILLVLVALAACGECTDADAQTARPIPADAGFRLKQRSTPPSHTGGAAYRDLYLDASNNLQLSDGSTSTPVGGGKSYLRRSVLVSPVGSSSPGAVAVHALPYKFPTDSTRFRIGISQRDFLNNLVGGADITGQQWSYGPATSGLTDFSSAPTTITGVTYPANGAIYVSPWISLSSQRGSSGYTMLSYSAPTGTVYVEGGNNYGLVKTGSSDTTNLTGATANAAPAFFVFVEYETAIPFVYFIGNSRVRGNTGVGANQSTFLNGWTRLYNEMGIGVGCSGVAAITLPAFGPAQTNYLVADLWAHGDILRNANVVIVDGYNDLASTVPVILGNYTYLATLFGSMGAKRIVPATTAPSSSLGAPANTVKDAVNAALRSQGDYLDLWLAERDPGTPTQLLYPGQGTTVHWSDAGYAAATALIAGPLATSGLVRPFD